MSNGYRIGDKVEVIASWGDPEHRYGTVVENKTEYLCVRGETPVRLDTYPYYSDDNDHHFFMPNEMRLVKGKFSVGDRVRIADPEHKAYRKIGKLCDVGIYGTSVIQLDGDNHGMAIDRSILEPVDEGQYQVGDRVRINGAYSQHCNGKTGTVVEPANEHGWLRVEVDEYKEYYSIFGGKAHIFPQWQLEKVEDEPVSDDKFPVGTRVMAKDGKLFGLYSKGTVVLSPVEVDKCVTVDFDEGNYSNSSEYHLVHSSYLMPIQPPSVGNRVTYVGEANIYVGVQPDMVGTIRKMYDSGGGYEVEWDQFESNGTYYPLRHFMCVYEEELDVIGGG